MPGKSNKPGASTLKVKAVISHEHDPGILTSMIQVSG